MRWKTEAEEALAQAGYEVIDFAGIDDWQGWGCLLGKSGDTYAVLGWSYGSCSGCDVFEDMQHCDVVESLKGSIEDGMNETDARARFEQCKGW